MHSRNQELFNLPNRVTAKIFLFKLMYGAMEYGYSQDPDFSWISSSPKFWKRVIDTFYDKYKGFAQWHTKIVQEVTQTSKLRISQTGREFSYRQYQNYRGEMEWPITQIKNYPVQGTGADLMALARIIVAQDWRKAGMQGVLVSSVHDSIVADVPDNEVVKGCKLLLNSFDKVPGMFGRVFGTPYDLPFKGEVQYGPNMCDMEDFVLQ